MAMITVFNGLKSGYMSLDGKTVYSSTDELWAAIKLGASVGPYVQTVTVQIMTYEDGGAE